MLFSYISNNATYVKQAPTLKPSVGAFFCGHGNHTPPTLVRQTPPLWFYALWATDSDKDATAMPLPVTPTYERGLRDLRALSPETAELAERIALDLKPELLSIASATLEAQLLDLMQEVAQQHIRCVTRLWDWLSAVASAGALPVKHVAFFVYDAAALGGPYGVVPE